jgi:hypothetical protein
VKVYEVTWVNHPDGRVIEAHVFTDRESAEAMVMRKLPLIGGDEYLVFEVNYEHEGDVEVTDAETV